MLDFPKETRQKTPVYLEIVDRVDVIHIECRVILYLVSERTVESKYGLKTVWKQKNT